MVTGSKVGKVLLVMMVLLVVLPLALAECPPDCPAEDQQADYSSPDYVNNLGPTDLATAIEQGKISDMSIVTTDKLASALDINPSVSNKLQTPDLVRAVNFNPSLINGKLNPIFLDVSTRLQQDTSILNDNYKIKEVWFYNYGVKDEGAEINSFDGKKIEILGLDNVNKNIRTTKFTVNEVPLGSRVLKDGRLIVPFGEVSGTEDFKLARGPGGNPLITEGQNNYQITGGTLQIDADVKEVAIFADCPGTDIRKCASIEVNLPKKVLPKDTPTRESVSGKILYKGSFRFFRGDEGDIVASTEGEDFLRLSSVSSKHYTFGVEEYTATAQVIKGTVLEPGDRTKNQFLSAMNEFILIGDGSMKDQLGDTTINFKGDRLYYSENKERDTFCKTGFSCLINRDGNTRDPSYRTELRYVGIKQGDEVSVSSSAYFNKVLVDHIDNGKAIYRSTEKKDISSTEQKVISEVIVSGNGDVSVDKDLAKLNVGRFDVTSKDPVTNEEKMQHWSSNSGYKTYNIEKSAYVENYFESSRQNSFVTCYVDKDCEQKFAESFGKVIKSKDGSSPTTTIIIAGDAASSGQSMEKWCRKSGTGCLILNSRDLPPKTNSKNLVITGHHWANSDYIWRDAPSVKTKDDSHNPIDRIDFKDFPEGDVKKVFYSSCNTVPPPDSTGELRPHLVVLIDKYPEVDLIQGWYGLAPLNELMPGVIGQSDINDNILVRPIDPDTGKTKGERSWLFRDMAIGKLIWTKDGKTFITSSR